MAPQAALEAEAWWGETRISVPVIDAAPRQPARAVWGAGGHLAVFPLAERLTVLQPTIRFGVERIDVDDDAERTAAFVGAAGLRASGASGWIVDVEVRNHFLSVEDQSPDPERDASLWEARLSLGYAWDDG